MTHRIRIYSYFSLPTDLAKEMRDWPEFLEGEGYSVDLKSTDTGEMVTVRFFEFEDQPPYLDVSSTGTGLLFDRVLGRVIYSLADNSDNLMVDRKDRKGVQ